jgi:glycosyltransferase involved in cell wall biosynthesis
MIGDGEDRESLARRAKRLGVERSVSFLGALFGPEKHERLMAADLFIHTSRWEGMPTAVLEAASLALPLLISEATGLGSPVAASQAGFVLRENNAEAISRALLAAEHRWHSDGLRAMGSAARTMIQDVFSWRHVTGRVVDELYGAALG